MRGSANSCTAMVGACGVLLHASDPVTDKEFKATLDIYKAKPLDDEGHVPDDLGLLDPVRALAVFVQGAMDAAGPPLGINDVTDQLLALGEGHRSRMVQDIVDGKGGWRYEALTLPVGCVLR